MFQSHDLYAALLLMCLAWRDAEVDDERSEQLECMRECMRSLLATLGLQRGSTCFAECWVLLTEVKICAPGVCLPVSPPSVNVASACPSSKCGRLRDLGRLRYADILEEEVSSVLQVIVALKDYNGGKNPEVDQWLSDLLFQVNAVQLALVHRVA